MSLTTFAAKAILAFHKGPPVSALEEYDRSNLKKLVDAVAGIAQVTPDGSGSFTAVIEKEHETLTMTFTRNAEGDKPGFSVAYDAAYKEEVERDMGGFKMTRGYDEKGNGSYDLSGTDMRFFKLKIPSFIPVIGGFKLPMPDEMASVFLDNLQYTAPKTCEEIVARSGLAAPVREPNPLEQIASQVFPGLQLTAPAPHA